MEPDRLEAAFREKPAVHRFPGSMARRVQELAAAVVEAYDGDAGRVWRDAKITQIYEGTQEVQRLVIAREMAKESRAFLLAGVG